MALSYLESYGTGGGATDFFYSSLSLLSDDLVPIASQLRVYVNGTLKTNLVDYTVDTANGKIVLGTAVFTSDLVRIARFTQDTSRFINYTDSTNITAQILNTDATQLFFLVQEAKDLQTDAMVVGVDGKWGGNGKIIGNIAAGVDNTDAVNVAQLNAAVLGVSPATLGGYGHQGYVGDGSTTDFTLPTQLTTLTDTEDVEVFISGIRQSPSAYSFSSGDIVFSAAPANLSVIDLFWTQGVVAGILTDSSIETDMLQPKSVTEDKIGSGSNTSEKVLKADGSGGAAWSQITSASVSDFNTQVRTNRLDQMTAPTAAVSLNSQKITNLAAPTAGGDAATKTYVDSIPDAVTQVVQPAGTSLSPFTTVTATSTFSTLTDVGLVNFTFPLATGSGTVWASGSVVITSGFTSNATQPIKMFVPKTGADGLSINVVYARSGASNNVVSWTFTIANQTGAGTWTFINTGNIRCQGFTS